MCPSGCFLSCAWRLTSEVSTVDTLPHTSNVYCLPGRAGGPPGAARDPVDLSASTMVSCHPHPGPTIPGGNAKNGITWAQARRQDATTVGNRAPQGLRSKASSPTSSARIEHDHRRPGPPARDRHPRRSRPLRSEQRKFGDQRFSLPRAVRPPHEAAASLNDGVARLSSTPMNAVHSLPSGAVKRAVCRERAYGVPRFKSARQSRTM